ncbi:MAG: hypothetical protein WBN07_00865 [Woeseiaceae bacterium]
MNKLPRCLVAAAFMLAVLPTAYAAGEGAIEEALASPVRTDADRERDKRDKPLEVLEFAGFGKGMLIADVFGGGGYYSEILSVVVGDQGEVLLVNNAPYDTYIKAELTARLANDRLANVRYLLVSNEALGLGSDRLDGALIIMSYHDLFYDDPDNNWPDVGHDQFIDQIVSALKPGGRLLIVDHAAKPGTGGDDTQRLHRIDEQFAKAELTRRGLVFVGSMQGLRNPEDDRSISVFDPAIRGKSDRFVHLYKKPIG